MENKLAKQLIEAALTVLSDNRLKITKEDLNNLRSAMVSVLEKHPDLWNDYQHKGLTKTRFLWDVLHYSKFNTTPLYKYLNDASIQSALSNIFENWLKDQPK